MIVISLFIFFGRKNADPLFSATSENPCKFQPPVGPFASVQECQDAHNAALDACQSCCWENFKSCMLAIWDEKDKKPTSETGPGGRVSLTPDEQKCSKDYQLCYSGGVTVEFPEGSCIGDFNKYVVMCEK